MKKKIHKSLVILLVFILLFRIISTMEEEQRRMQSAVYDVLNDIDRKCLRTLQVSLF